MLALENPSGGMLPMSPVNVVITATMNVIKDRIRLAGTLANSADFRRELQAEEDELLDSLDGFKYYPVIAVGLSFKITP